MLYTEKLKLREKAQEYNINWTQWGDKDYENFRDKLIQSNQISPPPDVSDERESGLLPPVPVKEADDRNALEVVAENTWDALTGFGWSALDTALFSLPSIAWQKADEESYREAMMEMQDTTFGMIGSTLGSVAGFMAPMGVVGRASTRGLSALKNLTQTSKAWKGQKIAAPTTKALQVKGAKKIRDTLSNNLSKTMSKDEALNLSRELTDETIGFANSKFKDMLFGSSAHRLESITGAAHANIVKDVLRRDLPKQLATKLANTGLKNRQITKLSDELLEIYSTMPANGIYRSLSSKIGSRLTPTIGKIAGNMIQEGVEYSVVANTMEGIQYAAGNEDYGKEGFLGRSLFNFADGSIFGLVKFIPGGTNIRYWDTFKKASGRFTTKLNQNIGKMGLEETKAFARDAMKVDRNFIINIDGINITQRMLRSGSGSFNPKNLNKLKGKIQKYNINRLQEFRGPYWTNIMKEMGADFYGSFTRMAVGAVGFMLPGILRGEYDNVDEGELWFNAALGGFMSKKGVPLRKSAEATGLAHFGERPYYYDSDMNTIYKNMERMGIRDSEIGSIARKYEGNLFADWLEKNHSEDAENVIKVLEDKGIIYKLDEYGEIFPSEVGPQDQLPDELLGFIQNVTPMLRTRNYSINPRWEKKDAESALQDIKSIESSSLSDNENTVSLTNPNVLYRAIIKSSLNEGDATVSDMLNHFSVLHNILTGETLNLTENKKIPKYNISSESYDDGSPMENLHQGMLRKYHELQENLQNLNIIGVYDINYENQAGISKDLTRDNAEKALNAQVAFEHSMGREMYGFDDPIDMNDKGLWNLLREMHYTRNVEDVYGVLNGSKVQGVEESLSNSIMSDVTKITSGESNRDPNLLVNNPNKIKIIFGEDFTGDSDERIAYENLKTQIWDITTTHKKADPSIGAIEVDWKDVKRLSSNLVKAGMPDPIANMGNWKLEQWHNKIVNHGIDIKLSKLDPTPYQKRVIKNGLQNGWIIASTTTKDGQVTSLEMPEKLSKDMLKKHNPNLSNSEIDNYIKAHEAILKELSPVINTTEFAAEGLQTYQLDDLISSQHILETKVLTDDVDNINSEFKSIRDNIEHKLNNLKDPSIVPEGVNVDATDEDSIKLMMASQRDLLKQLDNLARYFASSFGGGKEIARISAFLEYFKKSNILKNLKDASDGYIDEGDLTKLSQRIKDVQTEIANSIASKPTIQTQFNTMREEIMGRRQHEEVEGMMPSDSKPFTPEAFISKYNINIPQAKEGFEASLSTPNTASDLIWDIYNKLVIKGEEYTSTPAPPFKPVKSTGTEAFTNKLFDLANTNRDDASPELRSEITKLTKLMARRFNIKRLSLNLKNKKGTFESGEISKGFLTDTFIDAIGHSDMIILDRSFMNANGVLSSLESNKNLFVELRNALLDPTFFATEGEAFSKVEKLLKNDTMVEIESNKHDITNIVEGVDINSKFIQGENYIVGIDENIDIVLNKQDLESLIKSYIKFYENFIQSDYAKNIDKNKVTLLKDMEEVYNDVSNSLIPSGNEVDWGKLTQKHSNTDKKNEYIEDIAHLMFNSQYAENSNKDWLNDIYKDTKSAKKYFKYLRLAQNLGYSRNSDLLRNTVRDLWVNSDNDYNKELVNKYTDKETIDSFVIDDGDNSVIGEDIKNLITDNRSIYEARLLDMKNRGKISEDLYNKNLDLIKKSHYINAEAVNGQTLVRREYLDYLMLLNGDENLIGSTSGQKPVGLTSWEDQDGVRHILYNKTHYFYDSRLDDFFDNNDNIDMIAFTSGAKKAKAIDTKNKNKEVFKPYSNIPKATEKGKIKKFINKDGKESTMSIANWLNSIKVDSDDAKKAIMKVKINQTLSGVNYAKPHDARISKQFENYGSEEYHKSLYKWARQDLADKLADISVKLFDPANVEMASEEAKSFLTETSRKESNLENELDNMSSASIWIEAGGVPFSSIAENAYNTFIKNRYIKDRGLFDGYTDAGGSAILRGNNSNNLDVPVFDGDNQMLFGEANIGAEYLDRNIHFISKFGKTEGIKRGLIRRPGYKEEGTLTIAYTMEGRDILVDMDKGTIYDPMDTKGKITDGAYSDLKNKYDQLRDKLGSGDIRTYRDVFNTLREESYDKKMSLFIDATPQPRTGPHDVVGLKVRSALSKKDGGVLEMNVYDLTSRAQRDFDTDKIYFYMDTPFSISREHYIENGKIKEPSVPRSEDKRSFADFNPLDRQSFRNYKDSINEFKRYRGPVIKMHRKLTYAKILFKNNRIQVGEDSFISFVDSKDAQQRLVTDSQDILDIYDGIPKFFNNVDEWNAATLFGNTRDLTSNNTVNNNPFFVIQNKKGETTGSVSNEGHRLIIQKLLSDYGYLLNLEGNIWESGQQKDPTYSEMIQQTLNFRETYKSDIVNYKFYSYLVKKGQKDFANKLFYDNDSKKIKKGLINDVMSDLTNNIFKGSDQEGRGATTFLKSLDSITKKDYFSPKKLSTPSGNDTFNDGVMKMIGKSRDEALKWFQLESRDGDIYNADGSLSNVSVKEYEDGVNTLNDKLWNNINDLKKDEGLLVQLAAMEKDIQRLEYIYNQKNNKSYKDEAELELMGEDILIKKRAQEAMLTKLQVFKKEKDGDYFKGLGQQRLKFGSKEGKYVKAKGRVVIRNKNTGKILKVLDHNDGYNLTKNEVAVFNPINLKSVVEHDLIDGMAWMYTVGKYNSKIHDKTSLSHSSDFKAFEDILKRTKRNIKDTYRREISKYGVTNWEKISALTLRSVEEGLRAVRRIAIGEDVVDLKETDFGMKFPEGKESYPLDFLMSLLRPDESGNPYEYSYVPSTSGFHPTVKPPSKAVISSVMHALDAYNIRPHNLDRNEFIGQLAKTHRAFYDAIVGERGFSRALSDLHNTQIEGALVNHLNRKVLVNPFMTSKEFKTLKEEMDISSVVSSDMAELFRQMFQEGAITDPMTFLRLKQELVNTYGEDAYDGLVKEARGYVVHDGIIGNTYGFGHHEGQVLGHRIGDRYLSSAGNITGKIEGDKGGNIRAKMNEIFNNNPDCQ